MARGVPRLYYLLDHSLRKDNFYCFTREVQVTIASELSKYQPKLWYLG